MRLRKELIDEICKKLVDEGKLLEAGWRGYELAVLPEGVSQIQVNETRVAFFAGAQHLFWSIMGILEPDAEPTEADMRRMSAINDELEAFLKEFKLQHGIVGGQA